MGTTYRVTTLRHRRTIRFQRVWSARLRRNGGALAGYAAIFTGLAALFTFAH